MSRWSHLYTNIHGTVCEDFFSKLKKHKTLLSGPKYPSQTLYQRIIKCSSPRYGVSRACLQHGEQLITVVAWPEDVTQRTQAWVVAPPI
eukprot:4639560-Amphidinium_carterae.1